MSLSTAEAFLGPIWAARPVTWTFDDSLSSDSTYSGPLSVTYEAAVTAALQRWSSATGLSFKELEGDPAQDAKADIRFGFGVQGDVAIGQEVGAFSFDTDGTDGRYFQPGNPEILLRDPVSSPLQNASSGGLSLPGNGATVYQVALHEIGHALGLDHNSDPNSIMNPALSASNIDLDANDIQAVTSLYNLTPPPMDFIFRNASNGAVSFFNSAPDGSRDTFSEAGSESYTAFALKPNVTFDVGAGNNTLVANSGNNFFEVGAGNNTIYANADGVNTFIVDVGLANSTDLIVGFHPGNALFLKAAAGGAVSTAVTSGPSGAVLQVTSGADTTSVSLFGFTKAQADSLHSVDLAVGGSSFKALF